jgi:hypothetical protein
MRYSRKFLNGRRSGAVLSVEFHHPDSEGGSMRRSFALLAACGLLGASAVVAGSAAVVSAGGFLGQASASPRALADGTPTLGNGSPPPAAPGKWFVENLGPKPVSGPTG